MHKIHVLHLKGAAVQPFQSAGLRGELKGEFVGVERLPMTAVFPVFPLAAVFAVADQRVPRGGELGADLVGASGDQVALHEGQIVVDRQYFI